MLRRLDLEAAYLAYGLAVFWLAASSFFAWLAINGFGQNRDVLRPSISITEYIVMIGICLTPTLVSCGLATLAIRKRRQGAAVGFGFAALFTIAVCFAIAALWANHVAASEI
jgi:hypothetical protein